MQTIAFKEITHLWNSCVNLFAMYPFKYKLLVKILSLSLNTMLIVDKHVGLGLLQWRLLWRISGATNWMQRYVENVICNQHVENLLF